MIQLLLLATVLTVVPVADQPQVKATRDGGKVHISAFVPVGELHEVAVVTARGPENVAQVGKNEFVFDSPYDSGFVHGVVCTDEYCQPVQMQFRVEPTVQGFFYVLGLAVLAGVLLNFMPCVLPVLGLKLMAASKGGGKLPYVLGVLVTFAVLATGAVILGTGLSHMAQPYFRVMLALTCLLMGTHFLGLWHLPGFALPKWASGGGAFGLGITTVALGSSCSVPFLAPVLVYTANHVWWETYLLFLAVGVGFASPFILPIYKLFPKPGAWMLWFEKISGAALILVAGWLACTLAGGPLMALGWLAFWSLIIVISHETMRYKLACAVVMAGTCLLLVSVYGRALTPPTVVEIPVDKQPGIIFVTADWCLNCKPMYYVIDSDEVKAEMAKNQGHLIVLDWTNSDPAITEFMAGYGIQAVPFALVISPTGRETVLSGAFTKQQVLDALR